jgi:hypothetical protein
MKHNNSIPVPSTKECVAIMTYYYTLHDEGTDYGAAPIAPSSIEGEDVFQFGARVLGVNHYVDRTCVVYPASEEADAKVAFPRTSKVADIFGQEQHGSAAKPFRIELQGPPQPRQNGKLRCCFCILVFKCCFEYGNTVPYSCIRWNGACCCSS